VSASRFPGTGDGWARFDGPAGTQMVDVAIDAMDRWMRGPHANTAGGFAASDRCDELLARARLTVAELLGADPAGVCFGPNMTTMTLAFTRAVASTLQPGERVVGTRLDHDANVTPWRLACDAAGAEHVLAPFDTTTGRLTPEAVVDLIDERTRWVALPGASNLLGTIPDLAPAVRAAHDAGAHVFVDGVHLVPHRRVDVAALGADVFVTSAYKWYGPHAAALWCRPELLDTMPFAKVRPAPDEGPRRFEMGTPSFEAIAGVDAAARFLLDRDMAAVEREERAVFAPLLAGLLDLDGVTIVGPATIEARTPTVAFTIDGHTPEEVSQALAGERIATWWGHSYAVEAVDHLGLADRGGVVRAGLAAYTTGGDVARLLDAVARLAHG
jgi:cysteine desulfurase family protein (TIGR01976 family)